MPTPKLDIKRVIDAGVGVTDLAVGTVRDYAAEAQKRVAAAQQSVKETVTTFDPKATYTALEKRAKDLQAASRSTATDAYGDLVKRGQTLVGRIRRQPSTQEVVKAAESTKVKAKTTKTQAKKAATSTRRNVKATKTAAKKTVSAGSRALADASKKVGD